MTSINRKQLLLRSCDEEGCLIVKKLNSRRELMVIPPRALWRVDRFQLDFSGKPHTACKTLNSSTSSTELITKLFLLSLNNSKTLGFTHFSTRVHRDRGVWRLAMNKEIPVPGQTCSKPGLPWAEVSVAPSPLYTRYVAGRSVFSKRWEDGNVYFSSTYATATSLGFSSVSASLSIFSITHCKTIVSDK